MIILRPPFCSRLAKRMIRSRTGVVIWLGVLGITSSGPSSLRGTSSHMPENVLSTYKVGIGLVESRDFTKLRTPSPFQSLPREGETTQTRLSTPESSSGCSDHSDPMSPSSKQSAYSLRLTDTNPGNLGDYTSMSQLCGGAKIKPNSNSPRTFRHILRGGADPECFSVAGTPAMKELWERAKRSPVI